MGVAPLFPNQDDDELLIDHNDHAEIVYMDKECVAEKADSSDDDIIQTKAEEFRTALLDEESDCLEPNAVNSYLNQNYEDFYFYLAWKERVEYGCAEGIEIDMEAYCISAVHFEPILKIVQESGPGIECMETSAEWHLDALSG